MLASLCVRIGLSCVSYIPSSFALSKLSVFSLLAGFFARFGDRVTFIEYVEVKVDNVVVRLLQEGKFEVRS